MASDLSHQFSIKSLLTKNEEEFNSLQNPLNNPLQNNNITLFQNQQSFQLVTPTLAELQIFFGLNG